jgi:uncharacterized protein YprB with RNaseH-like and TPR domain
MKVASFDIETTGLRSTYGRCLCACFKFHNEPKVREKMARYCKDEVELLNWISDQWDEADIIVSWNGKLFDQRFVNGRRILKNLKPLDAKKMHKDIMYEARSLRMTSCSLENVGINLGLTTRKVTLESEDWVRAAEGEQAAHKRILSHCVNDVIMLQEAFERLKPLVVNIHR